MILSFFCSILIWNKYLNILSSSRSTRKMTRSSHTVVKFTHATFTSVVFSFNIFRERWARNRYSVVVVFFFFFRHTPSLESAEWRCPSWTFVSHYFGFFSTLLFSVCFYFDRFVCYFLSFCAPPDIRRRALNDRKINSVKPIVLCVPEQCSMTIIAN